MKRFSFRLQTLLDVAVQRERAAQQALAQAQSARNQSLRRLDATLRQLAAWDQLIRGQRRGAVEGHTLNASLAEANAVARRAEKEREDFRASEREVTAATTRLHEAACARKTVERLREQARDAHNRDLLAEQAKLNDDIVSVRVASDRAQGKAHPVTTGAHA